MAKLIPTRSRFPISRELAYPLGAELLSRELDGVPQFELLTVSFFSGLDTRPAHYHQEVADGEHSRIVKASWTHHVLGRSGSRALADAGDYDARWSLTVYPVPRHRKVVARSAMHDHGFAALRSWFHGFVPAKHERGSRSLLVSVRLADGSLTTDETRRAA